MAAPLRRSKSCDSRVEMSQFTIRDLFSQPSQPSQSSQPSQHPSSTSSFALPSEDSTRTSLTSGDSRIQSNVADYSPNTPSFLEYYQDIDWQRIKGRWGPAPGGRGKGTSPIWAYGWRIAEHDTNKVHWLCRRCYQKRIPTKP
ncbi:hypothetical protein KCU95_g11430, partial [Aureobasidium melanogenum]